MESGKCDPCLTANPRRTQHGQSSAAEVRHTDKDWYVIHDDREKSEAEDGRRAGTHDLGDIKILATRARQLGDIWVLVTDAIADLAVMGPEWGFKKKLVVKYPMGFGNSIDSFDSYSNPINGSVYIKEDQLFARTILHEVFHQWVYGRTTGEDGMAWQLVKHQDIHGKREFTTFVPFHEALADWAAYRLLDRMTGGARQTFHEDNSDFHPDTPYSRDHLGKAFDNDSERLLANVDYTERGWTSFFKLLTYPKLYELDLNGQDTYATDDYQTGPRSPRPTADLSFPRVLKVFNTDVTIPESAHKLANADLTFERLLPRAQAVCPALTDDVVEAILLCLDPNATRNPGADCSTCPRMMVNMDGPSGGELSGQVVAAGPDLAGPLPGSHGCREAAGCEPQEDDLLDRFTAQPRVEGFAHIGAHRTLSLGADGDPELHQTYGFFIQWPRFIDHLGNRVVALHDVGETGAE